MNKSQDNSEKKYKWAINVKIFSNTMSCNFSPSDWQQFEKNCCEICIFIHFL